MRRSERILQTLIYFGRWIAAPFLIGLFGGLVLLLYRFFADLFELAIRLPSLGWHDLVVGVLNLVDIALTANLILIVIFSGYENFIRKVELQQHPDWPPGLIDIDFAELKQKLLGSIAVIAAIDALAWYLDLEETTATAKLAWAIGFPLMFVAALLMLALADRLAHPTRDRSDRDRGEGPM